MSGALKPYPTYKESGVEWLGAVPEGWEVVSSKRVVSIVSGATPSSTNELYWDGQIVWYTPADLSQLANIEIERSARFITIEGLASCGAELVPENSIILATRAPIGPVAITSVPACTNQGCKALVPTSDIQPRYLTRYIAAQNVVLNMLGRGSTFLELPTRELSQFPVPLPPLPEQQAIADYLDAETQRIDTLIAELREMIRLLKEKRQALISHCVTKGLDPTVPMKDSGVEWLGEVPEGWEVIAFRHVVTIAEGQVDPTAEPYSGMDLVGSNHIVGGMGILLSLETAVEQGAISGKYYCPAGSILYSKIRPSLRKVAIAPHAVLCSADIYPMNADTSRLANRFLRYLLLSDGFSDFAINESDRVAMPKINRESLASFRMPIPPLPEQRAIAAHLDRETAKIDRLISETEETITLMQERRSALISSVVTGKLQVPGIPQPSGSTLNSRPETLQ